MSQSPDSMDTQALLQSMLQRLKIQQGRDGQTTSHTSTTTASTWGQVAERGVSGLHNLKNSPVNGFDHDSNSISSEELVISAVDHNSRPQPKGGIIQKTALNSEVGQSLISFATKKDSTNGDMDHHNRGVEKTTQARITSIAPAQQFPAKSHNDINVMASEKPSVERFCFDTVAMNSNTDVLRRTENQYQDFTPKVYAWSLKPTSADVDTGSQQYKVLFMENGGFGALAQSKDTYIVSTDQSPKNSSLRRKQTSSEKKPRRWTQKIKEKWKDRPGSFGKKQNEQRKEQQSEQGSEISPEKQLLTAETLITTSSEEKERAVSLLHSSGPSETSLIRTEDSVNDVHTRSSSDFDFGLGSFSLLEEIIVGQEWAKFLKPNNPANSADQRPANESKTSTHSTQPSLSLTHEVGANNKWDFRATEALSTSNFSMAQTLPDAFQPVNMDISEDQWQHIHREAERTEPMGHVHTPSDRLCLNSGNRQQIRPLSYSQPTDTLNNSSLSSKGHLNRKRQHQPDEKRYEGFQREKTHEAKHTDREGSMASPSSHETGATRESQQDSVMASDTLNSPPLSPSFFTPLAHPPKGVLKHSISQDSESSVEIRTKKRRVEENRRVHFSEEVVTIISPEVDSDSLGLEEDSKEEEPECEEEQVAEEEVGPARRTALPAWILSLKRRKTK